MDLDGDGIISMYEMEYFYNEQLEKMQRLGIETLAFPDCLCLVSDRSSVFSNFNHLLCYSNIAFYVYLNFWCHCSQLPHVFSL